MSIEGRSNPVLKLVTHSVIAFIYKAGREKVVLFDIYLGWGQYEKREKDVPQNHKNGKLLFGNHRLAWFN